MRNVVNRITNIVTDITDIMVRPRNSSSDSESGLMDTQSVIPGDRTQQVDTSPSQQKSERKWKLKNANMRVLGNVYSFEQNTLTYFTRLWKKSPWTRLYYETRIHPKEWNQKNSWY